MEDVKICKDCKHAIPARGFGFLFWKSLTSWKFAKCEKSEERSPGYRLACGRRDKDELHYCATMREHEHLCGVKAKFFELRG